MPTYDYRCDDCGAFALLRPMAQRDDAAECPGCGKPSPRALVAAPALAGAAASATADAMGSQSHGAGCGCCGPVRLAGRADGGRAEGSMFRK